mmetsp:Transcript_28458/g.34567  ORF Transcript_28458/g.34567 Transcript_28458/m.34567 type:complete len:110 (+) Transcript_28458:459-788(+)
MRHNRQRDSCHCLMDINELLSLLLLLYVGWRPVSLSSLYLHCEICNSDVMVKHRVDMSENLLLWSPWFNGHYEATNHLPWLQAPELHLPELPDPLTEGPFLEALLQEGP